ncbi:hypothetical protein GCM10009730_33200 [Streptomyces albidochromogenes]
MASLFATYLSRARRARRPSAQEAAVPAAGQRAQRPRQIPEPKHQRANRGAPPDRCPEVRPAAPPSAAPPPSPLPRSGGPLRRRSAGQNLAVRPLENQWNGAAVCRYRAAEPSRLGKDVPLYTV